jgi:hypothetical protein
MKGVERRKYIRVFLVEGKVQFEYRIPPVVIGNIIDISVGGIRFSCEETLEVGDEVNTTVSIPEEVSFKGKLQIVRAEPKVPQQPNIYGAQFVGLDDAQKHAIGEMIMKKCRK